MCERVLMHDDPSHLRHGEELPAMRACGRWEQRGAWEGGVGGGHGSSTARPPYRVPRTARPPAHTSPQYRRRTHQHGARLVQVPHQRPHFHAGRQEPLHHALAHAARGACAGAGFSGFMVSGVEGPSGARRTGGSHAQPPLLHPARPARHPPPVGEPCGGEQAAPAPSPYNPCPRP